MKFSILIPTLGQRPAMLEEAIASCLSQDYQNFEVIVSSAIPLTLPDDPRVIFVGGQNRSLSRGLNLGMIASTGDVFSWIGDDDYYLPGALRFVAENLGEARWGYGQMLANGNPYGGGWDPWTLLHVGNPMPVSAVFWTRRAWKEVGGFDESLLHANDYDYWIRLGMQWAPVHWVRDLSYYRVHPDMGTKKYAAEVALEAEAIRRRYEGCILKQG